MLMQRKRLEECVQICIINDDKIHEQKIRNIILQNLLFLFMSDYTLILAIPLTYCFWEGFRLKYAIKNEDGPDMQIGNCV